MKIIEYKILCMSNRKCYVYKRIVIASIYKMFADMTMEGNLKSYETTIMPVRLF